MEIAAIHKVTVASRTRLTGDVRILPPSETNFRSQMMNAVNPINKRTILRYAVIGKRKLSNCSKSKLTAQPSQINEYGFDDGERSITSRCAATQPKPKYEQARIT